MYPQSMLGAKIRKNIKQFLLFLISFLYNFKNHCIYHGHVSVMLRFLVQVNIDSFIIKCDYQVVHVRLIHLNWQQNNLLQYSYPSEKSVGQNN